MSTTETKSRRKIVQYDEAGTTVVAEHVTSKEAATAIGKANAENNIKLCCSHNHLEPYKAFKSYGFCWRFSD